MSTLGKLEGELIDLSNKQEKRLKERPIEEAMDRWITFLVLDLGLDIFDGVAALDLQRDGLPRQRLHEDLHLRRWVARSLPPALPPLRPGRQLCCGLWGWRR